MKNKIFHFSILILIALFFISGCQSTNDVAPYENIKIGMITDKFGDLSYNDLCLRGLLSARDIFGIKVDFRDGVGDSIISSNIKYYIDNKYDMVIFNIFTYSNYALQAAKDNPGIKFVQLDYSFDAIPQNLLCAEFLVDEAAFPLGFLAAYWAGVKNPSNPKTATIGGIDAPTIHYFTDGFDNGVKYFNNKYGKTTKNRIAFAGTFGDELIGKQLADSMINDGATVIFPAAGETGLGVLKEVKIRNQWAIGVDDDQYISFPDIRGIFLSSCMKNSNNVVFNIIKSYVENVFKGGVVYKSNLKNNGVGMAPYHDFDSQIPDSIKTAIEQIKQGIIDGSINTLD